MAALVKNKNGAATALLLSAFLMTTAAMIVIFSSFTAADTCYDIGPCKLDACHALCLLKNYTGNFETYCMPSFSPGTAEFCCCRVPGG